MSTRVRAPRPSSVPFRVATAAEWEASWVILKPGEQGRATDTGEERSGDGIHRWRDLPTSTGSSGPVSDDALAAHINDLTPHPAYDDIPSVVVLFENGLV